MRQSGSQLTKIPPDSRDFSTLSFAPWPGMTGARLCDDCGDVGLGRLDGGFRILLLVSPFDSASRGGRAFPAGLGTLTTLARDLLEAEVLWVARRGTFYGDITSAACGCSGSAAASAYVPGHWA